MKIDPKKKPFRCKYILRERVRRVHRPAAPPPAPTSPSSAEMPKGMSMETLDRIIQARGRDSRARAPRS